MSGLAFGESGRSVRSGREWTTTSTQSTPSTFAHPPLAERPFAASGRELLPVDFVHFGGYRSRFYR